MTLGIRDSTQREAGRTCEALGLTESSGLKANSSFHIHSQIFYRTGDLECIYAGFSA